MGKERAAVRRAKSAAADYSRNSSPNPSSPTTTVSVAPISDYDAPCIQAGCTGAALYYRDPILPGTPGLYSPVLGPAGLALARAGGKHEVGGGVSF